MQLILKGRECGFKFSASHLLPGHFKCSRMHGHNYIVDLEIDLPDFDSSKNSGMLVDFVQVKKDVRKFLEEFDHKFLLPNMLGDMEVTLSDDSNYWNIEFTLSEDLLNKQSGIYVADTSPDHIFENKKYMIPHMDCVRIHNAYYITAETLAKEFKRMIIRQFSQSWHLPNNYDTIFITVYEDDGQGARA